MRPLDPREAYRLWAPSYAAETVVTVLDQELTQSLSPSPDGQRLLDAGCGIARRLPHTADTLAVGIDLSPEMLAAGGDARVAAADVRALPFADGVFDLVWCRLVLGHLADPMPAYRELARVCRPGGHLLVTDFHADAVAAGHKRSLRDANGTVHDVEHHVHDHARHGSMAMRAGLTLAAQGDGVVGASVQHFYREAGRENLYEKDFGQAMVAAFLFRRGN